VYYFKNSNSKRCQYATKTDIPHAVTPCNLSGGYPHFGGTCFRLQGQPCRREHYENMLKTLEWTIHVGQMKSGKRRTLPTCLTTQAQKYDRNKAKHFLHFGRKWEHVASFTSQPYHYLWGTDFHSIECWLNLPVLGVKKTTSCTSVSIYGHPTWLSRTCPFEAWRLSV
jgi:hypothetical protein